MSASRSRPPPTRRRLKARTTSSSSRRTAPTSPKLPRPPGRVRHHLDGLHGDAHRAASILTAGHSFNAPSRENSFACAGHRSLGRPHGLAAYLTSEIATILPAAQRSRDIDYAIFRSTSPAVRSTSTSQVLPRYESSSRSSRTRTSARSVVAAVHLTITNGGWAPGSSATSVTLTRALPARRPR